MTNENNNLLEEIFLKPSLEVKTERFAEESQNAPCSGTCSNGACRAIES